MTQQKCPHVSLSNLIDDSMKCMNDQLYPTTIYTDLEALEAGAFKVMSGCSDMHKGELCSIGPDTLLEKAWELKI